MSSPGKVLKALIVATFENMKEEFANLFLNLLNEEFCIYVKKGEMQLVPICLQEQLVDIRKMEIHPR